MSERRRPSTRSRAESSSPPPTRSRGSSNGSQARPRAQSPAAATAGTGTATAGSPDVDDSLFTPLNAAAPDQSASLVPDHPRIFPSGAGKAQQATAASPADAYGQLLAAAGDARAGGGRTASVPSDLPSRRRRRPRAARNVGAGAGGNGEGAGAGAADDDDDDSDYEAHGAVGGRATTVACTFGAMLPAAWGSRRVRRTPVAQERHATRERKRARVVASSVRELKHRVALPFTRSATELMYGPASMPMVTMQAKQVDVLIAAVAFVRGAIESDLPVTTKTHVFSSSIQPTPSPGPRPAESPAPARPLVATHPDSRAESAGPCAIVSLSPKVEVQQANAQWRLRALAVACTHLPNARPLPCILEDALNVELAVVPLPALLPPALLSGIVNMQRRGIPFSRVVISRRSDEAPTMPSASRAAMFAPFDDVWVWHISVLPDREPPHFVVQGTLTRPFLGGARKEGQKPLQQ